MRRPRLRSLTARLAILFSVFSAVVLLSTGLMLERAVDAHFDELDEHDLSAKLNAVGNLLRNTGDTKSLRSLPDRLDATLRGYSHVAVLVRDADGTPLYAIRGEHLPISQLSGLPFPDALVKWQIDGRHYIGREEQVTMPLSEPQNVRVLAALDVTHHHEFLAQMRTQVWIKLFMAVAAAGLLAWFFAHRGLAPLRRMTLATQRLSAEKLEKRFEETRAPAEVADLIEAFNGMLNRLEAAFKRLNDYSANIAHELRTPISNLMTETQVALSRTRTAEEYRETLHSNLEEFERLARMVSDMLLLAKAENGSLQERYQPVMLHDEISALLEFHEALAEEKDIRFELSGEGALIADRLMLQRAIANLLSNAIAHTPATGVITIGIENEDDIVKLVVSNPGARIPEEHLPHIFERFHRVDASRSRSVGGSGLGLAITRSIIHAHGGRIHAYSDSQQTHFLIELPRGENDTPS